MRHLTAIGRVNGDGIEVKPVFRKVDGTIEGLCISCGEQGYMLNLGWRGYTCPSCGSKVLTQGDGDNIAPQVKPLIALRAERGIYKKHGWSGR